MTAETSGFGCQLSVVGCQLFIKECRGNGAEGGRCGVWQRERKRLSGAEVKEGNEGEAFGRIEQEDPEGTEA